MLKLKQLTPVIVLIFLVGQIPFSSAFAQTSSSPEMTLLELIIAEQGQVTPQFDSILKAYFQDHTQNPKEAMENFRQAALELGVLTAPMAETMNQVEQEMMQAQANPELAQAHVQQIITQGLQQMHLPTGAQFSAKTCKALNTAAKVGMGLSVVGVVFKTAASLGSGADVTTEEKIGRGVSVTSFIITFALVATLGFSNCGQH